MSDVIRVEVYDAQDTAFSITFLEPPLGKVTIQYEAESNRDMSKCFSAFVLRLHIYIPY